MAVTESKKLLQVARRKAGRCIQCNADADGKSRCSACAQKNKNGRQARREKRKAAGVCTECQGAVKEGCVLCQTCIDKSTKCALDRYYRNKEAGVCRYCGADSGGKARCTACTGYFANYSQQWYQEMKAAGRCPNCGREHSERTILCRRCCNLKAGTARDRWACLKQEAFDAYGGAVCSGCNFDNAVVLEIDHIDGGGTEHRKQIGQSNMYLWLKQNDYPPGYRVLCPTCNKLAHAGIALPNEQNKL